MSNIIKPEPGSFLESMIAESGWTLPSLDPDKTIQDPEIEMVSRIVSSWADLARNTALFGNESRKRADQIAKLAAAMAHGYRSDILQESARIPTTAPKSRKLLKLIVDERQTYLRTAMQPRISATKSPPVEDFDDFAAMMEQPGPYYGPAITALIANGPLSMTYFSRTVMYAAGHRGGILGVSSWDCNPQTLRERPIGWTVRQRLVGGVYGMSFNGLTVSGRATRLVGAELLEATGASWSGIDPEDGDDTNENEPETTTEWRPKLIPGS